MTLHARRWLQVFVGPQGPMHELIVAAVCVALGIFVVPFAIALAGHAVLGSYGPGEGFALWRDYLQGLAQRSPIHWALALGPYVLLWALRLWTRAVRG